MSKINYSKFIKFKIIEDKNRVVHTQKFNLNDIRLLKGTALEIIDELTKKDKFICVVSQDFKEMLENKI